MSLVIRYLQGCKVEDDFVGFIDCHTEKYELDPDTMEPVLTDLESPFSAETTSLFNLNIVIPNVIREIGMTSPDSMARALVERFNKLFHQNLEVLFTEFKSELRFWKAKWVKTSEEKLTTPDEASGALAHCGKVMFPLITLFLEILITLPISVASSERSFFSVEANKMLALIYFFRR
ncbi:hypothetical protein JTB14_035248 [Gonioctena quinquepunctata]|nr:hypothetical protein JTB14_035248 [Gonioctena quinquepunctata]